MNKSKITLAGLTLMLLLAALPASVTSAYPIRYGPYETNKAPAVVPAVKCELIQKTVKSEDGVAGTTCLYRDKTHPQWSVKLTGKTNGWAIELLDERGNNRIIGLATNSMESAYIEVYAAELNGDKQPDFIVNVESGGCGLAAEMSEATFILSSKSGYRATSFEMWDFDQHDIITVKQKNYLILTRFIYGDSETARDKRNHNYWVYQLRRIDGDNFRPANDALPGFPKWVWYSNRENHKETDLMSREQKQRLLNEN